MEYNSIIFITMIIVYYEFLYSSVPLPTSVTVTSVPLSPIRPVGSDVTLTCAVELNPMVDIPVTVITVWTGPAGFMTTNTAQPVVGNTTFYISMVIINLFGRNNSGVYTCRATISSASLNPFINDSMTSSSTRVTVGKITYCCALY